MRSPPAMPRCAAQMQRVCTATNCGKANTNTQELCCAQQRKAQSGRLRIKSHLEGGEGGPLGRGRVPAALNDTHKLPRHIGRARRPARPLLSLARPLSVAPSRPAGAAKKKPFVGSPKRDSVKSEHRGSTLAPHCAPTRPCGDMSSS